MDDKTQPGRKAYAAFCTALGTIAGLAIAGAGLFLWWLLRLCRQTPAEADQVQANGGWLFADVQEVKLKPRVWIAPGVNILDSEKAPPGVPPGAIVHIEHGPPKRCPDCGGTNIQPINLAKSPPTWGCNSCGEWWAQL